MNALAVLAHHSEPGDPELLEWLIHTFESLVGLGPLWVVVLVSVLIVVFPLGLGWLAWRARRGQDSVGGDGLRAR